MKPTRPFFVAFTVLAVSLVSLVGCGERPKPITDIGPPKVTFATPKVDQVRLFTDITGTVVAPQSVEVRPRVSGFINEVVYREGQMVQGPVYLFSLEVRPGDALFRIDPVTYQADLTEALGQVAVKQAQLALAKADEARAKVAFEKGVSSQQEYDSFVAKTKVAQAELEAAQGPVTKARQNLEWTTVRAPITGRTGSAKQTRGNVVTGGQTQQGTVLTTIVSIDPMYVYFDVDDATVAFYQKLIAEGKLKDVSVGEVEGPQYQVDIKMLGEDADEKYDQFAGDGYDRHGRIDFAGNQLNPTTGTLAVRGVFDNPDGLLVPGRYVRGRVPLGQPFEGVLIPDAAVVTDQGNKLVYVVNAENRVEAKPVTLGPLSNGLRVVQSGLTKDDRVIYRGVQTVQPGMPVDPDQGTIDYPKS